MGVEGVLLYGDTELRKVALNVAAHQLHGDSGKFSGWGDDIRLIAAPEDEGAREHGSRQEA